MARTVAKIDVPGSRLAVERKWMETANWPLFIDGCARVERVDGPWPRPSAEIEWCSVPSGRGRVVELVVAYEEGRTQVLEISDASMHGTQTVSFESLEGGVEVALELDYHLVNGGFFKGLMDALFVRRTVAQSLDCTLVRFAAHLSAVQCVDQELR